jgi:hypothetical protein
MFEEISYSTLDINFVQIQWPTDVFLTDPTEKVTEFHLETRQSRLGTVCIFTQTLKDEAVS